MKVYLVENVRNSSGKVYAVMADKEDAEMLADSIATLKGEDCKVIERTLFYSQPSNCGYNE